MKRVLLLAFVIGLMSADADAARNGHQGLGYRRGRMDWSHLGPRPASAVTTPDGKRASLAGKIEKESYPVRYDLRDEGLVSMVKDQGAFGACWAFAACGSLESALLRRYGLELDLSERNVALFWGGEYDAADDWNGLGPLDKGGDTAQADAYFLRWAGPVLESDDPYPPETTPALDALREKYGSFFTETLASVEIAGERIYEGAELSLDFLAVLDFDDWTVIDREANKVGLGLNFRTNFIHTAKVMLENGKKASVPHVNRSLIPDEAFVRPDERAGMWREEFHVQGNWRLPPRTGPLDNETYKYALMKQGAVSVSYHQDMDWRTVCLVDGKTTVAYYCPSKGEKPNHQVLLVGWDDEFPAGAFGETQPPANGAFLLRNNWGEADDAGGYFWVSYYDTTLARIKGDVASVYSRVDDPDSPENYDMIHGYDTLGLGGSVGIGKTSATAANMFVAAQPESVRAVGTHLLQWNTRYTVKVYTGCTAGKPTSGVLAYTQTGTREFPGYETIDLDREIPVAAGERYSVVVTFTTEGLKKPVPVQIDDTEKFRYSKKGRSYLKNADGTWTDLVSAYNPKKAFSTSNSPKTFCCKVYADGRETTAFDGDGKGVYTIRLSDGSTLTVMVSAASGGVSSVSAKIVKNGKTLATYAARKMSTKDGFVILKGANGKDLWLTMTGDEMSGNALSATLGGTELAELKPQNPNVTGYDFVDFRVGVAAKGLPQIASVAGKSVVWSAKGLPDGVTVDTKTGALKGSPMAVVKTEKTARVTASVSGGGSDSYAFRYTVNPLHTWAKGTKTGGGERSLLRLTVGSTGKVSGKLQWGGTNWTFSASCLTSYAPGSEGGTYTFSGRAVSGKVTLPISFDIEERELANCTSDVPVTRRGVATGSVRAGEEPFEAYASVWGVKPYSAYAKLLANAPSLKLKFGQLPGLHEAESLSLRFGKNGAVTAVGLFKGVRKGKSTDYKVSLSTTLVPVSATAEGDFAAQVFTAFAPNASYRFKGFAARLPLVWDDFLFRYCGEGL